ncbi:hypothetical protein ACFDR9_003499, partial [Janthinobacterium sp. CG_23.3]
YRAHRDTHSFPPTLSPPDTRPLLDASRVSAAAPAPALPSC